MAEDKKDAAENEEARVPDDDPRLRGHALQDHERVKHELDGDRNPHEGNPVRSNPDLVPGERDKALEQVRKVRAANEERTRRHSTVAIEEQVAASTAGGNEKFIDVSTANGVCFVNTHGEAALDRDGVVALQQKLAKAFQAVS